MTPMLTISKLDAAKRQIEVAIRMYFHHGDPVAIHTLAAASYNVLRNLNDKRGGEPMFLKETLIQRAKPEKRKALIEKINEAENFFKHADRDHDATLDFRPDATDFVLLEGCDKYQQLSGEITPTMAVFRTWMMVENPDIFLLKPDQAAQFQKHKQTLGHSNRVEFFNEMMPAAQRAGIGSA
jgi:hypothetical protein